MSLVLRAGDGRAALRVATNNGAARPFPAFFSRVCQFIPRVVRRQPQRPCLAHLPKHAGASRIAQTASEVITAGRRFLTVCRQAGWA